MKHTSCCLFIALAFTGAHAMAQGDHMGEGWQVEAARYGGEGRFVDVTRQVDMARHEGDLDMLVSNENFGGDPAPNVAKRLDVLFRSGEQRIAVSAREGDHLHAPMMIRKIIAASYHGREGEPKAFYRGGCIDVTDRVRARFRDGMLEMQVNNSELGGDPAPGVVKQLTVRFFGREERDITVDEGALLRIPENAESDPRLIHELMDFRDQHRDHRDRR